MCGIVYKHNFDKKQPVNNDILQQYDKQSRRGKQGFGVFDGTRHKIFRTAEEDDILNYLCSHDSNLILFHHRYPTSTINVAQAAHPLRTGTYFGDTEYVMVHNGIIHNADRLFVKHMELGIPYHTLLEDLTFNDSESLLWDFALTMEGKQESMTVNGDMAFVVVKLVKGSIKKLHFGRNGRPLNIWRDDKTIELSSEGRGSVIPTDMLHTYDFHNKSLHVKKMVFDTTPLRRNSQGYRPTEYFPPRNTRNEYKSYDEYHLHKQNDETKKEFVERKWNALRSKAQAQLKRLTPGAPSVGKILETKQDDEGRFIVDNNHVEDNRVDVDSVMQNRKYYEPTSGEIQNFAMSYIMEAEGCFEQAYSLLEFEYAEHLQEHQGRETMNDIRQQLLFEAAMEFINSDPEYEDEFSTSSVYSALWEQMTLPIAT